MQEGGFIDCHCHLAAEQFSQDVHDVIERSRKAGVQAFVSITEQENEFEKVIGLAERYPGAVMPCFGVHPIRSGAEGRCSATVQDLESALPLFDKYKDKLVAIGEVGLDFTPWLVPTPQQREEQQRVLALQLAIAKQLDLPIHAAAAENAGDFPAFLPRRPHITVFHLFLFVPTSTFQRELGYAPQQAKLIKQIPLENICLESDSPSLGPNKEERNEPEKIRIVCQYIAAVKGVSVERVCEVTTKNALKLFPKVKHRLKE